MTHIIKIETIIIDAATTFCDMVRSSNAINIIETVKNNTANAAKS